MATKYLTIFWDWVDRRCIVRRIVLGVTVWMVYEAFSWAARFASATEKDGAEVGLIIAAVTGPIAVLQGYVFKLYSENRSND